MSTTLNPKGQPAFFFVQTTDSATWLIPHGLNKRVVIDVCVNYKGSLTKIIPHKIVYTDENTITVMFSKPMSGTALLN